MGTLHNKIIFTKQQEKQIIDMYTKQNLSTVKIGKYFNVCHKVIARILEEHNIPRTGVGQRKYKLNEKYFDKIDTPTKAYILGFFYADGCNYKPKSTISMSLQEEDVYILERIRREIGSERELDFLDYSNKHDFGYIYKNQYRLLLFSSYMCNSLENKGMLQNKSLILQFPNEDILPKELIRHFIRGYFDGDGSVTFSENGNCRITITSTECFCKEIKKYIYEEIKINSYIYDASNHNDITKVLSIGGKNNVKKFLDYIYKDADIYLIRKYLKYVNKYYNSSSVA